MFNPFIRDGYTGQVPLCTCPVCFQKLDSVTNLTSRDRPVVGDFSVCIGCLTVLKFGPGLRLEKSSLLEVPTHLRAAVAKVIRVAETMPGRPWKKK